MMTTTQATQVEEMDEDVGGEDYIDDNEDIVLVIGDVGLEGFQQGNLFWAGVGGSALNLADMLCEFHGIQTFLITKLDPLHGWIASTGVQRFHDIHEGLASIRIYQLASAKNLRDLNENYGELDISNYLAIATGPDIRFETHTGKDIDLSEQIGSIRESIDRSLVTVVDTRLTAATLGDIARVCHDQATPLVVMSNNRKTSRDKFAALGNAGGCDLVVMNPQDKLQFRRDDPCRVTGSKFTAYITPEDGAWEIEGPGQQGISRGEVRLEAGEMYVDRMGVLEGFTGGYIVARFFEGVSLEDRVAYNNLGSLLKIR